MSPLVHSEQGMLSQLLIRKRPNLEDSPVSRTKDKTFDISLWVMALSGIFIQFTGRLFVAEIFFVVIFLSLLTRGRLRLLIQESGIRLPVKLLILVLVSQIASDLFRRTTPISFLKGSLLIIFTLVNLIVITYLVRFQLSRYLSIVVLYSASVITSYLFQPQLFGDANPWKFGFGYPLTAVFFCVLTKKNHLKPTTIFTLCTILSGVDFLFGARNLAAITFLSGVLSALSRKVSLTHSAVSKFPVSNFKSGIKQKRSLTAQLLLILFTGLIIFFAYKNAVTNGLLGEEEARKYKEQTSTGTNLLFSSRSEIFSEYLAISESPIIGHGSYAPMTAEFRQKLLPWLLENNLKTNLIQLESGIDYVIPVHSGILAFWVWFGILSVPFFAYVLHKAILVIRTRALPPIIYYFAILICWDVFFSPFGMYARMQYPISIVGMILFNQRNRN